MQDALEAARPTIAAHVAEMHRTIGSGEPMTQRDWAGFFANLGKAIAPILPLVLPLLEKLLTKDNTAT